MTEREDWASDVEAVLELNNGNTRVPVLFRVMRGTGPGAVGYLRLAYGQSSFINRLLNSSGDVGRLVAEDGAREIRITSSEPREAPGYLCAFRVHQAAVS